MKIVIIFIVSLFIINNLMANEEVIANETTIDKEEIFNKAVSSFKSENYPDSLAYWKELISLDPEEKLYIFNLANTYYALRLYDLAIIQYDLVIDDPKFRQIAKIYKAKSLYRRQQFKESYLLFKEIQNEEISEERRKLVNEDFELVKEELTTQANQYFFRAMNYYENSKYKKAIILFKDFEKGLADKSQGYFMLGLTYLKLEDYKKAEKTFNKIDDPKLKKDAIDLLKINNPETRIPRWNLFFDLSLGYNDNANFSSDDEEKIKKMDSNGFLGIAYNMQPTMEKIFRLGYQNIFGRTFENQEDNSMTNAVLLEWGRFYSSGWKFTLEPRYEYALANNNPYTTATVGTLNLSKTLSRNYNAGMNFQYRDQKSLIEEDRFLNGNEHNSSIFIQYYKSLFGGTFDLSFGNENFTETSALMASNKNYSMQLSTYYKLNINWMFNFSYQLSKLNYLEDEEDFKRLDETQIIRFGPTYYINDNFSGYFEGRITKNHSNLEGSSYLQNGIALGISYFQ